MATIKPIEGRSVHQIQSGQVIVDLNSVVKELVENSLDAGATSIEVRFRNNGLDTIEVQDNGSGIAPDDFETIALKHYTSKLATYDDLNHLQTFGFRGEALSSLCALSKFHIVTARAVDGPKGTKLEFEQSGKLKGTSVVAAKQGTSVAVETLFYNLPVRRKELEKTIKREYNKVLQLLNAYACISVGVKFSVSNQIPKGKKTVAFATNSNPNTKENIANVYGTKTLLALIPLNLRFEMDPSNRAGATQSARNWSTREDSGSREVRILGHISRPVVGEGRQTPDRQMFFVNSRPCLLPQVAKAFNEVYKSYNITQSPFIFADIKLDTNAYDVNVSPDKRTILLHDQTALLENLKTALIDLFEGHDQSVPQAQLLGRKLPAFKPPTIPQWESTGTVSEERVTPSRAETRREKSQAGAEDPSSDAEEIPQRDFIKASMIERFASKDAEERVLHRPARRRRNLSPPERERSEAEQANQLEQEASPNLPHMPQLPIAVQDFNARIASQHAKQIAQERSLRSQSAEESEQEEEQIPAIKQTSQKRISQSMIQNAFDRMRPMKTPVQQATITIGDTTTISTIGTESRASKRARIYTPKFSLTGTPLNQTPKRQLVFGSLHGFVAPGTQIEASDEEEEQEDEAQVDADPERSMTDAPVVSSPSLRKRSTSNSFVGSSTNELCEISRTPTVPLPPPAGKDEDEEPAALPEAEDDSSDDENINESDKKAREEAKIAKMIAEAEEAAARPSDYNLKRANKLFQASRKKYATINLERIVDTSIDAISHRTQTLYSLLPREYESTANDKDTPSNSELNAKDPEERLSLTVTKSDFSTMQIIGQFNLGFILALRPPNPSSSTPDLFIIDQHASDEKYNFERFSNSTVLENQQMVHPHPLQLDAVEEEVLMANENALLANGFKVEVDTSGDAPSGRRVRLTSLPTSKGVTFTPKDLEELLALLIESPTPSAASGSPNDGNIKYIPRPSKVRKLLASRACRSSVMVGKTLKSQQMERIVRHMGDMDKPWSCPHGRPTMRHLFGLDGWEGWAEGDGVVGVGDVRSDADWRGFVKGRR
ncbi:DNA mismatch repair protein MutL [Lojkania enalia]|uniref:DNA mismatch repair protein PMS1 n=1 Tax=Lojkania enalia TaxID=147567 RepID=A0A9P4KCD0_9PLEO|nr:DNA mismatch repair protein MutL [Didymosphaeria enalia]